MQPNPRSLRCGARNRWYRQFLHLLVNWDIYPAPAIAKLSPVGGHGLMLAIGVIEIVAGFLVAFKPRIGAYVVAFWLWGIIINLLLISNFFDIALRDFGCRSALWRSRA